MARKEKCTLRQIAISNLRSLHGKDKQSDVTPFIVQLPEYKEAKVISVYISTRNELSTAKLIQQLYEDEKTVLIPFWEKERMDMTEMSQSEYNALMVLDVEHFKSKYNHSIPMPDPTTSKPFTGRVDLLFIPGTVFSRSTLHRIGYGFGHYDRYLTRMMNHPTLIGVCHECQLIDTIDSEPHDIPMDIIVTPKSTIRRSKLLNKINGTL